MRNQYELFMALAAQVGALHEHVSDLREQYLRLRPNEPNFFVEAERRAAANTLRSKFFLYPYFLLLCICGVHEHVSDLREPYLRLRLNMNLFF